MQFRFGLFLAVCCMALSITAASAGTVNMTLTNMSDQGWTSVTNVDSSGRGGIYEKVGPYGGEPVGNNMFMFTEGNSGRASNPWSAITTTNYNGVTLSQITALAMRTSGFEGADSSNFQPPHFLVSFVNSGGNTRCAEWLPWTDGISRNPGNSLDAKFGTYDAMVDGSWFCAWTGGTYPTWADMITALGDCTIVASTPGYPTATAWRGDGFSVGFGIYDSSNAKYDSDGRGLVDWFDVGIDGTTTRFMLAEVEQVAAVVQITKISWSSPNVVIDFTSSDLADTTAKFTLQQAGTLVNPATVFANVIPVATITGSAGSFQTTFAPTANPQFYRINRQP